MVRNMACWFLLFRLTWLLPLAFTFPQLASSLRSELDPSGRRHVSTGPAINQEVDGRGFLKTHIVYLKTHGWKHMERRAQALVSVEARASFIKNAIDHHDLILSELSSKHGLSEAKKLYSYTALVSGFAAVLDKEHVEALKNHPAVLSVHPDVKWKPRTTQTYKFLSLDNPTKGLWRYTTGTDVIIGIIDSGVWPEHPSFGDKGYGPVPSKFKGICDAGSSGDPFQCNKKVVGGRFFGHGYACYAAAPGQNCSDPAVFSNVLDVCGESESPRDVFGHGTQVAAVAVGSQVPAVLNTRTFGVASGMAYSARISVYKTLWCGDTSVASDNVMAIEAAVADGVEVLSISLGPSIKDGLTPATDPVAHALYAATVVANIPAVAVAGDQGPDPYTVVNTAPWVLTVTSASVQRKFVMSAVLRNGAAYQGLAFFVPGTAPQKAFYSLITGEMAAVDGVSASQAEVCAQGSLDLTLAVGTIVLCLAGGGFTLNDKIIAVQEAQGAGLIVYNQASDGDQLQYIDTFSTIDFPTINIGYSDGLKVKAYITSAGQGAEAYILPPYPNCGRMFVEAPKIVETSSRGPAANDPHILKPNLAGPGDNIITANTLYENTDPWVIAYGSSMAVPHVAGVVALLRNIHPSWTPSMLFSALSTTAQLTTNRGALITTLPASTKSTPFEVGQGFLVPNFAADPGLVFPVTPEGYRQYLCSPSSGIGQPGSTFNHSTLCPSGYPGPYSSLDLNQPAVVFYGLVPGRYYSTNRTLQNVGSSSSTYFVSLVGPPGTDVLVFPSFLTLQPGQSKMVTIRVRASKASSGISSSFTTSSVTWTTGFITWLDNHGHRVRIPLTVNAA